MNAKLNRRQFLSTLEAIGASAALAGIDWARAADEASSTAPVKVETLASDPVLTIAHCCDPQLGFGPYEDEETAYKKDLEKLIREIDNVNKAKPDVVFFAGDMTNRVKDVARDWPEILKTIEAPIVVATGNHDVPEPVTTEKLAPFKGVFGKEYDSIVVNGWKIIAINSQYVRQTDSTDLYDAQVKWFREELEGAKAAGVPTIVCSHVPPFVKSLDEKDEYFNFPTKYRQTYVDYLVANGTRFYLAGHTHTTLERAYKGIPILNGETTSRNFDKRPYGFRLLKIDANLRYEWNFVANDE